MNQHLNGILFFIVALFLGSCSGKMATLKNDEVLIDLAVAKNGMPYLKKAQWETTPEIIFTGVDPTNKELNSIFEKPVKGRITSGKWKNSETNSHVTTTYSFECDSIFFQWNYVLNKQLPLLTTWLEIENRGGRKKIEWYPILLGKFVFSGKENTLFYADALAFAIHGQTLTDTFRKTIQSETYSSDHQGQLPSWRITGSSTVCFDLAWCGGWQANFTQNETLTDIDVILPSTETQLTIESNERVVGPKLSMTFVPETNESLVRQCYFQTKQSSAEQSYQMPESDFPLIYNHWYAAERNISNEFILNQLKLMPPYGFDAFVLDDGWFDDLDNWKPDPKLFSPGQLESALKKVKEDGVTVGIWSAPWLLSGRNEVTKKEIDPEGYYNKYMKASAIDLFETDYNTRLCDHIQYLTTHLHANWWKYDQEFLNDKTRHGKMKNIIAFQEALDRVRREFPELIIENCLSGGRMINDFTNTISQIHWIRDGGGSGLKHARSNIKEAMGAINFLPLSKVQRWTNRVDEIEDDELLRYYCRSAMIGVWGISTDLHLLSSEQQRIIQSEIERYRKLNQVKASNLFEVEEPLQDSPIAAITYYSTTTDKAYVLVFRWDESQMISQHVMLSKMNSHQNYTVTNLDNNISSVIDGETLTSEGFKLQMNKKQFSMLFLIKEVSI